MLILTKLNWLIPVVSWRMCLSAFLLILWLAVCLFAFKVYGHIFLFSTISTKGDNFHDFLFAFTSKKALPKKRSTLNPNALRKAKIVYNFGLSECNRVKGRNLFIVEQTLLLRADQFRRETKMKTAELLLVKVNQ